MANSPLPKRSKLSGNQYAQTESTLCENETLSALERFPRELLWTLIEYAPETVFDLRLSSRVIKRSVDEYAKHRKIIPLVDELKFSCYTKYHEDEMKSTYELNFMVGVISNKSNLFELRLKLQESSHEMIKLFNSRWNRNDHVKYTGCFSFDGKTDHTKSLGYLRENLEGRVRMVHIGNIYVSEIVEAISKIIEGVNIRIFFSENYHLREDFVKFILKPLKEAQVHHINLTGTFFNNSTPVEVLLDLASVVRILHINQHNKFGDDGRPFFFGLNDVEWAPIILDMFSRNLEELHISNTNVGYLNSNSVDTLRRHLPLLDKKVWFESTCSNDVVEFSEVKNDHLAKVYRVVEWMPKIVSIKHSSIMKNRFDPPASK